MSEKEIKTWGEVLIESQLLFWIWNTVCFIVFEFFAIFVVIKLKSVLEFQNKFFIFCFCICLAIREFL